ncbi:sigma-70 family RNA polymerase sigma factor [bacterium]|nr:sigma-70 family RNA polymerase sigma factor [candidate division CSSED10-310 bacterium]
MKPVKEATDLELVMEAQAGQVSAFEILIRRHQRGVRSEVLSILGNQADCDDVVQESFLSAFRRIDTLKAPYNFSAWIRQIARNKARNLIVRGPRFVSLVHVQDTQSAQQDQESAEEAMRYRLQTVLRAMASLSSPLRETARLSYLQQLSCQQVADRLQIPIGTVKRRLWESRFMIKKEVMKMLKSDKQLDTSGIAPSIQIVECPSETIEILSRGPGLYFGSVMDIGHGETCKFYDCPGHILTLTARTHIVRKVSIMGRNCIEVLVEHLDCEPPEANLLDYFEITDDSFLWLMRVTADHGYPQTRFMAEEEEVFNRRFRTGEYADYVARVVDLTVGQTHWEKCLAVWWAWADGTPVESFYTTAGREVLRRRFVGSNAMVSKNYDYEKLSSSIKKEFQGIEYRLWYITVLCESL